MIYYKLFFGEYKTKEGKMVYRLENKDYYGNAIVNVEMPDDDIEYDVKIDIKKWDVEIGKNYIMWHGNANSRNIDDLKLSAERIEKKSPNEIEMENRIKRNMIKKLNK